MSEAACKLKLCINRADAEVSSAFMIAPQANAHVQSLLNSFMSAADQQQATFWLEKIIAAFQQVNAKLVV